MRQVIDESRNAVRGLRSSRSASLDLEEALSRVPQELGRDDVGYRVLSVGAPRPLHPMLRDEVYRIGREAIVNAFNHSGASTIEAIIEYTSRRLRVSVRDTGRGIDQELLKTGREGHWGLSGMRERSERIGASLHVLSRSNSGTHVELDVPAHIAYRSGERPFGWRWSRKAAYQRGAGNGNHT
jgi:signal transduction histidine kinase